MKETGLLSFRGSRGVFKEAARQQANCLRSQVPSVSEVRRGQRRSEEVRGATNLP